MSTETAEGVTQTRRGTFVGFLKIVVADPARSYLFYRDVFGLEISAEVREHAGTDDEVYEFILRSESTGAALVLISYPRRASVPAPGEAIIGLNVADLDAVVAATEQAGGHVDGPVMSMPQHGVDVAFIRDPEGHLIEVVYTH